MANRPRLEHFIADPSLRDLDLWPAVNESLLTPATAKRYRERRDAVTAYLRGTEPVGRIAQIHNIDPKELRRITKRCLATDPNGQIYGFRALIANTHIKSYERTSDSSIGFAGSLNRLFERFPDIRTQTENEYLGKRNKGSIPERQMPIVAIHEQFLKWCLENGVGPNEWPFNTVSKGREALRRYLLQLYDTRQREAVHGRHGEASARTLDATRSKNPHSLVRRPFQRVQFDAMRINAFFTISMIAPDGVEIELVLERLWFLSLFDVASRNILGYFLSLNRNYTMEDVLQTVVNALTPWSPKIITIPGLEYLPSAGLPSGLIPSCAWRLFDLLSLDNAWAHLAPWLQGRLSEVVNCAINPGKSYFPEARGLIERFHRTMQHRGFNRLASTTGSDPKDSRRHKPEEAAVRYKIRLSELYQVADVLVANYCATPNEGILNRAPLEYVRNYEHTGFELIRTLPESMRESIPLFEREYDRHVRGKIAKGRRPYIQFEHVRYTSENLSSMPRLVGTKLRLVVNISDLRFIKAYLPDGSYLGVLRAQRPWNLTPHSLQIRRAIFTLANKGELDINVADPVVAYRDHLAIKSVDSKKHRNQLVQVQNKIEAGSGVDAPIPMPQPDHLDAVGTSRDWEPRRKHWISIKKTSVD